MQLAYAFPASAAEFSPDGKLSVLSGDFDTITAGAFPVQYPQMVLVVKLLLKPLECSREHQLRVEFIDADGKALQPAISLPFRAQPNPTMPHRQVGVGLVIHYQVLEFPHAGDYSIHVLVDDLELGDVSLRLVQSVPPGNAASEGTGDADER